MTGTKRMNPRRRRANAVAILGTLALLAACPRAHAADDAAGRIERIELKTEGSSTKVIVMLSRPLAFDVRVLDGDAAKKSARRLVLDFANTTLAPEATKPVEAGSDLLRQVRTGQFNAQTARIVLEIASDAKHSVDAFESPPHVTIALANPATVGMTSTGASAAPQGTIASGTAEAPKPADANVASKTSTAPVKTIPIRARWRKPYSLNYAR